MDFVLGEQVKRLAKYVETGKAGGNATFLSAAGGEGERSSILDAFSIEPAYLSPMLPTLRQLHYLKLLAEHGGFGRADEAAHVTQPTLSSGIQELERTLGAPVVDRARSGVILTAVGEEALRRATAILNEAEELVEAAKNAGQPLTGRFRLGVIPTVAPFLLPRALPLLRDRFPKLRLFLREDLTQRLIGALKAGQLDAALIALPFDMHGLDWAHVADDELLAAMPAGPPAGEAEVGRPARRWSGRTSSCWKMATACATTPWRPAG